MLFYFRRVNFYSCYSVVVTERKCRFPRVMQPTESKMGRVSLYLCVSSQDEQSCISRRSLAVPYRPAGSRCENPIARASVPRVPSVLDKRGKAAPGRTLTNYKSVRCHWRPDATPRNR